MGLGTRRPADPDPNVEAAGDNDRVTGFLPMEIFGKKRPEIGKVCSFKVVDVAEDGDVEVEYADHGTEMGEARETAGPVAPWDNEDADEMLNTGPT